MPKFDIKEHDKRMREIMTPPQAGVPLVSRLRDTFRRRKPRFPRLPRI